MAYLIEISDYQRLLLLKVMDAYPSETLVDQPGEVWDNKQEELECLKRMTRELPDEHTDHKIIYGFAL